MYFIFIINTECISEPDFIIHLQHTDNEAKTQGSLRICNFVTLRLIFAETLKFKLFGNLSASV